MTQLKAFTLASLLLWVGAGAQAAPSLFGFSGLAVVPDTKVLPEGTVRAGGGTVFVDREGSSKSNEWYFLSAGVLPGLEVGVSRTKYRTRPGEDTPLQAKFQVLDEARSPVGLAVGAADGANDLSLGQATSYVVVSRSLWSPVDEFTGEPTHPLRG
ncbi:MAG: hypothetical protein QHJ73_18305, partial [Armatimonadota bacterium]|nr:hypothetical protein [Armatimonadota bacterium]